MASSLGHINLQVLLMYPSHKLFYSRSTATFMESTFGWEVAKALHSTTLTTEKSSSEMFGEYWGHIHHSQRSSKLSQHHFLTRLALALGNEIKCLWTFEANPKSSLKAVPNVLGSILMTLAKSSMLIWGRLRSWWPNRLATSSYLFLFLPPHPGFHPMLSHLSF